MTYKDYNILQSSWETNVGPSLSRFIVFEVSQNEKKSKFVFNRNFTTAMAEQDDKNKEVKVKIEAIMEIKKHIDNGDALGEDLFFFEWYPGNFIHSNIPPKWYLDR